MKGVFMDHSESPIILRLKKATTYLLLLSLLDEEDMYGYQLASEIKQRSHELCAC
jgi:PadR family transcriptional regulator PadR